MIDTTRQIIKGEKVYLNAVRKEDLEYFMSCNNDLVLSRLLGTSFHRPANENKMTEWIAGMNKGLGEIIYAIRLINDDSMVGIVAFGEIEWSNQITEIWISINGASQSKGLGTDTMNIALDYAFNEINFHRVQLTVLGYNERAIKLYEKLGFIKEGTYREFGKRDGERYDMYLYGMLEPEYRELMRGK